MSLNAFCVFRCLQFFHPEKALSETAPSAAADTVVLMLKENAQNAPASYTNKVVISRTPRGMKQNRYRTYI